MGRNTDIPVMRGMADLVAALAWIKENIEAFGGDPDKVMIFGQSGGGGQGNEHAPVTAGRQDFSTGHVCRAAE